MGVPVVRREGARSSSARPRKLKQQVRGLDLGTYYLLETEAPKGYNLLANPVEVVISANETNNSTTKTVTYSATYDNAAATMTNGTVDLAAAQNANQPVATGTIENHSGSTLPSTGGMGTRVLYAVGGVMIVAGGIFLVSKKRLSSME